MEVITRTRGSIMFKMTKQAMIIIAQSNFPIDSETGICGVFSKQASRKSASTAYNDYINESASKYSGAAQQSPNSNLGGGLLGGIGKLFG